MARLPLRFYGDPVLAQKAQPISAIEPRHHQLAEDMIETMYAESGIGLAANQVGSLERIFVIDPGIKNSKARNPQVFLNPELLDMSVEDESYTEGCLSIPMVEADVYRPKRVKLRWLDLDGKNHEQWFDDLAARVIQHEYDHLEGVLFVDQIPESKRAKLAGKLNLIKTKREE
jgi:peptide deformylase